MSAEALRPPLFDAGASLASVLAWAGLPTVLRRALSRGIPPDLLTRVSLLESLRSPDARFREWLVGLLAFDIGVDLEGRHDNLIRVFAHGGLHSADMTGFCIHGVEPRQGTGASFRSATPNSEATVCAAAFVYFTDSDLVESEFVFIAGPSTAPPIQVPLALLRDAPLNEAQIARAVASVARDLTELGNLEQTCAVICEALLECQQALVPRSECRPYTLSYTFDAGLCR
ncbi:MAG: hypothetical protein IPJ65_02925 [Archangiaceae bacterium]|nr:hypothetical protein [Archangiaceae bacterium]